MPLLLLHTHWLKLNGSNGLKWGTNKEMLQANYCIKKEKREKKVGNEYGYVDFTVKVQFIYYSTTLHWYTSKERHRTKYQLIKEKLLGTIIAKVFNFYFIKKTLPFQGRGWFFSSSLFHYYWFFQTILTTVSKNLLWSDFYNLFSMKSSRSVFRLT